MRLGELRTKTRDLDNSLEVKLSVYDELGGYGATVDLDIDLVTDKNLYFRIIKEK